MLEQIWEIGASGWFYYKEKILVVILCTKSLLFNTRTVDLCVLYESKDNKRGNVRGNLTVGRVRLTTVAVEKR
jgi:hypothetical protein